MGQTGKGSLSRHETVIKGIAWSAYLAFHLSGQKDVPFLSMPEITERQRRRLRRMVRYAYRHVPYYRDTMTRLGIGPEAIRSVEDLSRLPIIENDDLRRDPEYYVSRSVDRAQCLGLLSSGSSGAPKTVWHDAAALFQNAAHGERERAIMTRALGRWSGYRETVIVSPVGASQREIQEFVRDHGCFPTRLRIERQYVFLSDPPAKNLNLINDFRPDLLYSYGSYLEMFFHYIRRTGADWRRPKAVLYSSDRLSAATISWLTSECGVPVFTVYGSIEALKIGFGCQEGDCLHANIDLYPIRIIDEDGREVEPGLPGTVVLSNLVNRGTVLLNFRSGDLASWIPGPCPCGRRLPRLSLPLGRVDEVVELPDGSHVHPTAMHDVCLGHPGMVQYQVRQVAPAGFRISLVAAPDADREDVKRYVLGRFRERFGPALSAEVRFVEELERTQGGKTPAVISLKHSFAPPAAGESC